MKRHTDKMVEDFKAAINKWRHCPNDDQEMIDCYKDDRGDLTLVLEMMKQGEYAQAWDRVADLDTIVRDQVPENVYDFLMSVGDPEMRDNWYPKD